MLLHDDAKIPDLDWQGLNGCQTTWVSTRRLYGGI